MAMPDSCNKVHECRREVSYFNKIKVIFSAFELNTAK